MIKNIKHKMLKLNLFNIAFTILLLSQTIKTEDQLRFTFELFTHGASSPNSGLTEEDKDIFNHQWLGQSELTGVGLRQAFLVGYRDRLRYIEEKPIIKPQYDARDILVLSTETNRTIMSAYAKIHGLFIPGTGPTIDPARVEMAVPPIDPSNYIDVKEQLDQDNYTALPGKMNIIPVHLTFPYERFTNYENSNKCSGLKVYETKNKDRIEVVDYFKSLTEKY